MAASVRSFIVAVALLIVAALLCGPAAAAEPGSLAASATVGGHDVAMAATGDPLPLNPDRRVDCTVTVTNHGQSPVEITEVQLVGRVLGLTFFSYSTIMDLTVAPGATSTVHYQLDFTDLKHQAIGLIGGQLVVRDANRDSVAVVPTVTDVRGSLLSVYGVFGMALVALTVLALVDAALAIARHRGSASRFRRGLHMLTPGIGIGLVLAYSASVARLWVPRTGLWLLVAGITAALFFAIGYFLTATPEDTRADDVEIDERDELDHTVDHEATVEMPAEVDRTVDHEAPTVALPDGLDATVAADAHQPPKVDDLR
jgi:hypothetical protein